MKLLGVFVWIAALTLGACASEKPSLYMQNKEAMVRAVKFYLAFEARHEVGPGSDTDLELPKEARFQVNEKGKSQEWIYPVALGLEIKIGRPGRRIVVMSPRSSGGRYLVATDDLKVKAYSKKDLKPIFEALERRRKKLKMSPLDQG